MDIRKAHKTEGYQIESLVKLCADESGMMMIDAVEAHGTISKTVISPNCYVYVAIIDGNIIIAHHLRIHISPSVFQ